MFQDENPGKSHNTKNDNTVQQILTEFLLWRLNMFPVTFWDAEHENGY
jgi:hypothetical protein